MTESTPDHVETTVRQMAELHGAQARQATQLQRASDTLTRLIGHPQVAAGMLTAVGLWLVFNVAAPALGWPQPDPPPFPYLNMTMSVLAFAATILILASQRHADVAATQRSQLTLQLSALSEQKIAKVIELLEEQRRENPALPDRLDPQAAAMAVSTDPRVVLERIIDTHGEAEREDGDRPAAEASQKSPP